jgi:EAL domain-containing protein (putative c-di-GMP-specific phosphodiesterase class I)
MPEDRLRRTLAAGEVLFREGDPGHDAFVIEQGSIEIYQERAIGRNVLARLARNAIFGEMALVGDQTRTASAMAVEPTVLRIVTHSYLTERLTAADPLLRHLLHVTMARSRESLKRIKHGPFDTRTPGDAAAASTAPDQDLALKRLRVEQDLERALANNEFQLHFQPILRLADGSISGFEALIRWIRPGIGRVPPNDFIWVAEECDLIVRIGHWVIADACRALNHLEPLHQSAHPGAPPLSMSVNLSIRQFGDPQLFPTIERVLQHEKLAPQRLRLEITESLVMGNMDEALALLNRCKELGCKLVVDDFGTGYSALSYLHKFPVDTLKLDRSFIHNVGRDGAGMKIVRAIAGLAGELGMETVIEGIEAGEQAQACAGAGVTYAQGFYFSLPLPLDEAGRLLGAHVPKALPAGA